VKDVKTRKRLLDMFDLRPYQQRACDAALDWMKSSVSPCLIDAAPASGKSFMVAYIARQLNLMSNGKNVLCIMPDSRLLSQNAEKFRLTGEPCSIFSASGGGRSTRHPVVMATPGTVKRSISRFKKNYCAVVIDEAHGLTPTILAIIEAMREGNPNLRVLGLTGTPFRRTTGYIFRQWPDGRVNDDDVTREPYFLKSVYRVTAKEMLDEGFITPMRIGDVSNSETYDSSMVEILPNGKADDASIERAYVGMGRKTAAIVHDIINRSRNRKGGIMYFASTIQHAREIMASLPPETSAIVTGEEDNNRKTIEAYKAKRIRHLVSVGMLATGFDVGHTETIALLRYTDSASLLTQILGRAWRLDPDKKEAVVLDYSSPSNIERHFPDGDIYNPSIRVGKVGGGNGEVQATCPDCDYQNSFSLNPDCKDYQIDAHGYCLDVFGEPIMTPHGQMPAHYGRRCCGLVQTGDRGQYERCSYMWTGKDCLACGFKNDIAARFCRECKNEIVDPNQKLALEFKAFKKDASAVQTDEVINVDFRPGVSQRGNKTIRADWTTRWRKFSTWHMPEATHSKGMRDWDLFSRYTDGGNSAPRTITYRKEDTGMYVLLAFDRAHDEEPVAA